MPGAVRTAIAHILAASLPLVLSACGEGTDPALAALQADPMATVEIEGTTTEEVTETPAGTTLGKPVYAEIELLINLADPPNPEPVLKSALEAAESSGWLLDRYTEAGASGEKDLPPDGRGEITVSVFEFESEPEPQLRITPTHCST
ncbi:MAG: hypothetical protein JJLCMIEE_03293 [Acidimicrobiales bacterium]|nr:MAG: hypothetical protein EDR02_18185 [Actinomycetota bacterium]MBV6510173.1 hypothetical protein [Acidimicrobiales bacterium]RIK02698.1 MAG: hypothetical protein DCC48_17710 [Acidobacteriota bacterium]